MKTVLNKIQDILIAFNFKLKNILSLWSWVQIKNGFD